MTAAPRHVAAPTAADLDAAWAAVRAELPATPLLDAPRLGGRLKLETMLPTGSFKVRGALAALAVLPAGAPVVTGSAGNHGLAVAWAAAATGRPATIVVPGTVSPAKATALERFPVTVERAGGSYDDAEARALELAARGAHFVSPYNDTHVIAGQASMAREVLDRLGAGATLVVPVGGGGLASGACLAGARVVGVEAAASTAVSAAIAAGGVVPVPIGETIADGMGGNIEPGSITPVILREHVHAMVTVSEEELRAGVRFLAAEHGLVAEGSGAAAAAAVLAGKVSEPELVAVVSGRNIALGLLASILAG